MKRVILLIATSSLAVSAHNGAAQTTAPAPAPAPAAAAAPPPPARSDAFADRYGILAEKNIFVRNRPPTRKGGTPAADRPRRAEEALILTGITIQQGRNVAFIENTATRSTERVVQGATIAGGKIVEIELDGLEFEAGGRRVRVAVGRNLLGDVSSGGGGSATAPRSGTATTAPPGTGAGGAPAAAPADEANLSVEERMKRARERLLGQ